jgi:hypothetical protein
LQNQARIQNRGTQELLIMYVVERWLSRLSRSAYADDFILKGGMLLASFGTRRPTVDVDALARNMDSDELTVARRVAEIAAIQDPEDGIQFLTDSISTTEIRADALYSGIRVKMTAELATAKVGFHLDINFGDPVTPGPQRIELPCLRPGSPPLHLLGYPIETVLAEKLVTAIELGRANTRVRDFCDIYLLSGTQQVSSTTLLEAITATASYRGTTLVPLSGAAEGLGALRQTTYSAYRNRLGDVGDQLPEQFTETVSAVAAFVDPVMVGSNTSTVWEPAHRRWSNAENN